MYLESDNNVAAVASRVVKKVREVSQLIWCTIKYIVYSVCTC